MKRRKWLRLIVGCVLTTLLPNGCSFSVKVLTTPTSAPPTETSISIPPTASQTPVPSTAILSSATPTLISIRLDTVSMLEIFMSVEGGEAPRSLAFTPDSTVLASAGGNTEDFALHLWDV